MTASDPRRQSRWLDAAAGLAIAATYLAAMLATSRDFAMVWDEGPTVRRELFLAEWFAKLSAAPDLRGVKAEFSKRELEQHWPFSRPEPDGHPPFYALLGLAGWWATRGLFEPLTAYRFGPMVLAAATLGIVYVHLAKRRGRLVGAVAAGAIAVTPQVFALAHYAHYDMTMSCLWLLAQMAFLNGLRSSKWIVPFGVAAGLAAGTKFTGLFALAPPLIWTFVVEWVPRISLYPAGRVPPTLPPLRGTRVVILGLIVAALTLYAIQPPWWSDPIGGARSYFASNMTRAVTTSIPTLYLGTVYEFALPWHNALVLTAVSIPCGILGLGLCGLIAIVRARPADREGWLWVLSWLVLVVVRALPITPGHDGVRLFLPSILSLAILAGIGTEALRRWTSRFRLPMLAPAIAGMALAGGVLGIVQLYPYTLSYYNAAIGGLKGAERHGFELTWYWDTTGREFSRWVGDESKRRPIALRFPMKWINIYLMRDWGYLPTNVPVMEIDPETSGEDYVLQRRRGFYHPYDWWLERNGHPLFIVRRQGVDLLRVYSAEEARRAVEATAAERYLKN
jgi:Dolichyl-phosphate-mannose-protein mannosyltransferase